MVSFTLMLIVFSNEKHLDRCQTVKIANISFNIGLYPEEIIA